MFNNTLSAILRGEWLIEEQFAISHLPVVLSLLDGKLSGQEFMKGDGQNEMPFLIMQNGRRVNAYIISEGGLVLNEAALSEKYVVVVPFIGPVTKYNGDCGEPGLIKRQRWISELTSNQNAIGYISLIDSPGGQADGTPQTADYIKSLNIPTAAAITGGAYSAGAWIASAHDVIYSLDEYSGFGSIGAYTTIVDFSEYFKKQGINVQSIYPHVSRDKNLSYRKAIKGDTKLIEEEIGEIANSFINAFANNRSGRLKSEDWKTGKTFNAIISVEMGLIDGIKPLKDIATELMSTTKESITQNQNSNMDIAKIKALAGTAVPGQNLLDQANAELTTAGITTVTLVPENVINEAAAVTIERDALLVEKTALTNDLSIANSALVTAQGSVTTAQAATTAEVNAHQATKDLLTAANARIAKGPGAVHTSTGGNDPLINVDEDDEELLAAMPHNQAADRITG